jgi:hypothetical protein
MGSSETTRFLQIALSYDPGGCTVIATRTSNSTEIPTIKDTKMYRKSKEE